MKGIKRLFVKYEEIIVYVFFGGITTLVNFTSFVAADAMGFSTLVATTAAWFISVAFAFATNRRWVFKSRAKDMKNVLRELVTFVSARAGTHFMDMGIMWFFIDYLMFNEQMQKYGIRLGSNVLVIIDNYLISKFIVFRKARKD